MGAGCTNGSSSYFGTPTPDKGVMYTGPAIPSLDICSGDYLNEIEAIILQKLLDFSEGKGISLPNVNIQECDFLKEFIVCCAEDKSLEKLFTILFKAVCSLKEDTTTLESKVNSILNMTFDLKCLTFTNPTLGSVINEIISAFCLLQERVVVLENTVVDLQTQIDNFSVDIITQITALINSTIDARVGNYILNHIFSCKGYGLVKSGTGSSASILFTGMVPPYCPIPYVGTLSNFDNNGVGLSENGMCGWYICNGLNGTPDMRGYGFASATTGVTGGGLDSRVASNPTNYLDKNGTQTNTLTPSNIPALSGNLTITTATAKKSGAGNSITVFNIPGNPSIAPSDPLFAPAASNLPFTTSGGTSPIDNRSATYNGVWIMRFN